MRRGTREEQQDIRDMKGEKGKMERSALAGKRGERKDK